MRIALCYTWRVTSSTLLIIIIVILIYLFECIFITICLCGKNKIWLWNAIKMFSNSLCENEVQRL